jgi:hypothetical protein
MEYRWLWWTIAVFIWMAITAFKTRLQLNRA